MAGDANCIVSQQAIADVTTIIQRCQDIFDELINIVEKIREAENGVNRLGLLGRLAWPLKEQKISALERRL